MANNSSSKVLLTSFNNEVCYSVKDVADITLKSLKQSFGVEITVIGEVVNFRPPNFRGYTYFTLLDDVNRADKYKLDIAIFNSSALLCNLQGGLKGMQDGMKVKVTGSISVYASKYQLTNITKITYADEGEKQRLLELLRKELEAKGYFALERKKKIPLLLKQVALLTAKEGEARHDFYKGLGEHFGRFWIEDINIPVQNVSNASKVASAIEEANSKGVYDIIFLIRGGGSMEDFDIFNSREVLDAIYYSKIPIITAIGHTQNSCLADEVADFSCATPTDAGNFIASNYDRIFSLLNNAEYILTKAQITLCLSNNNRLESLASRFLACSPEKHLQRLKDRFYNLEKRFSIEQHNIKVSIDSRMNKISELDIRLKNGLNIAKQAYLTASSSKLDLLENALYSSYKKALMAYNLNMSSKVEMVQLRLETFKNNKQKNVSDSRLKLLELERRLISSIKQSLLEKSRALEGVDRALSHLNPENVLQRGYAIISKGDIIITDASSLSFNDKVSIKLQNGRAFATIEDVELDSQVSDDKKR